jgi:hypothetical protein
MSDPVPAVTTTETLQALLDELIRSNTYVVDGIPFEMRPFTFRDYVQVTGKLSVLPTEAAPAASSASASIRANSIADRLLCMCSIRPKLLLEDPTEQPGGTLAPGCFPVSRLPDEMYSALVGNLSRDSGFSTEAAEEIRPSSETSEAC